jgi:hypothetical protein
MRGSIAALVACLLLAGVALAGCGGGGEGTTAGGGGAAGTGAGGGEEKSRGGGGAEPSGGGAKESAEPTSEAKAEFLDKAGAFCDKQRRKLTAKLRRALQGRPAALRRIAKDSIGPAMQAEAEEIRALGAPEGDEEQVEAIAAALEAIAAKARKDPAGLVANPSAFEKAQKLAGEYGIGACGTAA